MVNSILHPRRLPVPFLIPQRLLPFREVGTLQPGVHVQVPGCYTRPANKEHDEAGTSEDDMTYLRAPPCVPERAIGAAVGGWYAGRLAAPDEMLRAEPSADLKRLLSWWPSIFRAMCFTEGRRISDAHDQHRTEPSCVQRMGCDTNASPCCTCGQRRTCKPPGGVI